LNRQGAIDAKGRDREDLSSWKKLPGVLFLGADGVLAVRNRARE
jgi:hypothetical protein